MADPTHKRNVINKGRMNMQRMNSMGKGISWPFQTRSIRYTALATIWGVVMGRE